LSDDLAQANPGDKIEIGVLRDSKPVKVRATLGTRKN
jgi:S1-C subfamily serine protease